MEKQADPIPSFLTLQQAAKLLNLPTPHPVQKMIHRKQLPGLIVGSRWRIPKSALTKLMPSSN
jgi:excisionase family DNA binding protein